MTETRANDTPRFMNVHIIVSHGPNVMNRDDLGLQKAAIYGGKRRLRLSSQCLKRAVRTSDLYEAYFGAESIRTREMDRLLDRTRESLGGRFGEEVLRRAIAAIAGLDRIAPGARASAVAPWTVDEIADACEAIRVAGPTAVDAPPSGVEPTKGKGKSKKADGSGPPDAVVVAKALGAPREGRISVDLAMSGRMATSGAMTDVDGALYIAPALTTHAVDAEYDWFTAMDDLGAEGDIRAGHLDQTQFGSGVFYKFAAIDIPQLARNLAIDRAAALDAAAKYTELCALVAPGAKQHAFASFSAPDYVAVSFGRLGLNAATAFERPVARDREGGFLQPSIRAFEDYMLRTYRGLSNGSDVGVYTPWATNASPKFDTLGELLDWIRSDPEATA